jgi:hypothetical protein
MFCRLDILLSSSRVCAFCWTRSICPAMGCIAEFGAYHGRRAVCLPAGLPVQSCGMAWLGMKGWMSHDLTSNVFSSITIPIAYISSVLFCSARNAGSRYARPPCSRPFLMTVEKESGVYAPPRYSRPCSSVADPSASILSPRFLTCFFVSRLAPRRI